MKYIVYLVWMVINIALAFIVAVVGIIFSFIGLEEIAYVLAAIYEAWNELGDKILNSK